MSELERKENTIQAPLYEEIYDIVRRIAEMEGFSIILKDNADNLFYFIQALHFRIFFRQQIIFTAHFSFIYFCKRVCLSIGVI